LSDLTQRGFSVLPGRLEAIDLPGSSFDAIFLKQVIEHLETPAQVLSNTSRLLRPAGRLVVETPNFDAWDAKLFQRRYWGGYHFPRHWAIFDEVSLSRAGARAGLKVESVSFLLSPSFWVQSVHHLLKDRGWSPLIYKRFTHLNPLPVGAAVLLDFFQKFLTGRTSNLQIIFKKE
jgi:SAM-dependent methyltransferase